MEIDDRYAINLAKTEIREGYRAGDVERVLAVFSDLFVDMSEGQPSFSREEARIAMRARLAALFREYAVGLVPIIIDVTVFGENALAYGWHEWTMTRKTGGNEVVRRRMRFVELWKKEEGGVWRVKLLLDNLDRKSVLVEEFVAGL